MTDGLKNFLKELSWSEGTMKDWYLHSIDNESNEIFIYGINILFHELCKDFYVIPKDLRAIYQ